MSKNTRYGSYWTLTCNTVDANPSALALHFPRIWQSKPQFWFCGKKIAYSVNNSLLASASLKQPS